MPKSIQIFLFLLLSALFLVCVYFNEIERNVGLRLGPHLLGSKFRNLQSSDDSVTGVTPRMLIKSTNNSSPTYTSINQNLSVRKIDLAVIFCNAHLKPALKRNFGKAIRSLLKHCDKNVSLHLHLISDPESWEVAKPLIFNEAAVYQINVQASVYFLSTFSEQFASTIEMMQKHFSAKPGTYYSQALFYASIHIPDLLPSNVSRVIFIDIDTEFRDSIDRLNQHFDSFNNQQLMGLAPELSPVYRHILYLYRNKHKTTLLGEPKGRGFPGFNSGIVMMKLDRLRQSELFRTLMTNSTVLDNLASKYSFKGHLGDQDFYTLIGMEFPELFYLLPCNWNRQLCQWWKSKGYDDVFDQFYECKGIISLYHGNCNSQIPNVIYN